ncbi:MAG: anti-sigma factor [Proteobacteria bacterium]|nr:anti-sigma factor [Pseudomonadota bacterium]
MDIPHIKPVPGNSDGTTPVTEADLHAFADGLLSPARRADIEGYLARHTQELQRVNDWRAQNIALKGMLDPVLDEPLPLRLPMSKTRAAWPWRAIAAGVSIAFVSASSAWWLRGMTDHRAMQMAGVSSGLSTAAAQPLTGFAHRAAVAHAVFSPEVRRPVEVGAEDEKGLVTWLTNRMGAQVQPPDLRPLGYTLMGGRLLPGDKEPVAQFMFDDANGQRLTLYVTREDAGRETAFKFGQDGPVNVFYWVDKDMGYALSSNAGRQEMLRVAQAVYSQLDKAR